MTQDEEMSAQTADRPILKLIDFLSAYYAQRHPAVHDIATEGLFRLHSANLPIGPGVQLTRDNEHWLEVEFVTLPPTPRPEGTAAQGIVGEISPYERPQVISLQDSIYPSREVQLDETSRSTAQVEAAQRWIDSTWEPWSRSHQHALRVKNLYRNLFEQGSRLASERDIVELVWGFGMLSWDLKDGRKISHPILAIPVEIIIDEVDQTLRVRPEGALELQLQCLDDIEVRDRPALLAVRDSLAGAETDPWDAEVGDLYRRIARMLHDDGALTGEADHLSGAPRVDGSWVLYLRRRRHDYQGFLTALRDVYRRGASVPPAMSALVMDRPSTILGSADESDTLESPGSWESSVSALDSEPLLLPLPANEEQMRILQLAQERPGVTVQGPPGTGKTHTIANLISHYVAYGKRVLVVAEKEQALLRVTEKVPDQIRDLTVSVLGTDESGRRLLGASINRIQDRISTGDWAATDSEITRLTQELDDIDRRIAIVTDQLRTTRLRDVETLPGDWPTGPDPSPQKVASWLAECERTLGYIPDTLALEDACPLQSSELAEMCRLVESIGADRAAEAAYVLPEVERLPPAAEVARLLIRHQELEAQLQDGGPEIEDWQRIDAVSPGERRALLDLVRTELSRLLDAETGWRSKVAEQMADALLRDEWEQFVDVLSRQRELIISMRGAGMSHDVQLPEPTPHELGDQLATALSVTSVRGTVGYFQKSLKRALASCRVDGHEPHTPEEIVLCQQALLIRNQRKEMVVHWNHQLDHVDGPQYEGLQPEVDLASPLGDVAELLRAKQRWAGLVSKLMEFGIKAPAESSSSTAARLVQVCELALKRIDERQLYAAVHDVIAYLDSCAREQDASPLTSAMAEALRAGLSERYALLREKLMELAEVATPALRLLHLRAALASRAPLWAEQILREPVRAFDPSNLEMAWQWRQLETWLTKLLAGPSTRELQGQLEELQDQRRRTVAELVGQRAWRRLAQNLGDHERRALTSYLAAVSRHGKTGGKYKARWLAEMRRALDESKTAVPVWVMTTSRALSNFRPEEQPPFDVLIVDEASQAGFEALALLSLAEKTIIVGDDKQTSPENVGLDQAKVFGLLDDHLSSIPGYRMLFDPNNSLYDMANHQFSGRIMLVEHFRCLPEIIAFSSRRFYGDRIEPLRDQAPSQNWNALGSVKVLDGYRTGTKNPPEANAVVNLLAELISDSAYEGMSFGVVTLLAGDQARLISDLLFDRLGPVVIKDRNIRVGESAAFQGDERDVIVVSTVVGTDPTAPDRRVQALSRQHDERRINVAASRARQQMWVVHSVDPEHLASQDLRAELIRHCRDFRRLDEARDDALARCESEFERDVLKRIFARGFCRVRAQYEVGSPARNYRIDLVIEGPDSRRLAVECDGERWHGPERWHDDRVRQEVLERAGWTFERIRGSAFYRNPDAALQPLWSRLQELGIPTGDEWLESDGVRPVSREVYGGSASPTVSREELAAGDSRWAGPGVLDRGDDSRELRIEASEVRDTTATVATSGATPSELQNYLEWTVRILPPVRQIPLHDLATVLTEIVGVEGPMHVQRLYHICVKATGGSRVGRDIRSHLDRALRIATRDGVIQLLEDEHDELSDRTVYLTGRSPVEVRKLGSRQLTEVPRSEVHQLIQVLGVASSSPDARARRVLSAYGLTRLTDRARDYIAECAAYGWTS